MYAGHAGLALYAKQFRPRVPMALLVPVAFGPDWVQWTMGALGGPRNPTLSHSLASVLVGATVVAAAYWGVTRSKEDATIVWLTYASHWPADFVTAAKAFWPNSREVGLNLYQRPMTDVFVESLVIVLCWAAYHRSLSPAAKAKPIGWLVPIGLIGLQIGYALIQNPSINGPLRQLMAN